MIDRKLNYGREQILKLASMMEYPPEKILDVGVGKGYDLVNLHNVFLSAELFGTDIFDHKIVEAKTKNISVSKIDLDAEALPFSDEFFNLTLSNQTLEHVKNIHHAVSELIRVTSVNGYLIIGVPNLAALHNRVALAFGYQPRCIRADSAHVRGFTPSELIDIFAKLSGKSIIFKKYLGANFYPFPPVLAKLAARLMPSLAVSVFVLFEKISEYRPNLLREREQQKLETNYFYG